MKIIDFEKKGNVVKFYLGRNDCLDYWGDDWNDKPYNCNAGTVYKEFIVGIHEIAFPFDCLVLEPSDGAYMREWEYSKEDMRDRLVPCIIVVPAELASQSFCDDRFIHWVGSDKVKKYYFGDSLEPGKALIKPVEEIRVKYFDEEIQKLEKIAVGDWIDLRSAETVDISAGDYRLIRLGVGMILPEGYEAHVLPRSSTAAKFGVILANSMGVIDNSYSGDNDEWRFPALAIRDTHIEKGDRIAQFRIMRSQPKIEFKTVEKLNEISRGGIGSTGKR